MCVWETHNMYVYEHVCFPEMFANKQEEITLQVRPKQTTVQQLKQISIEDL